MTGENRPWSEAFHEAGEDWADAEAAASLLEDTKSAVMAQKQAALGEMPVNRAEQIVKASEDWYEYLERIVTARKRANLAKVRMEVMRMRFHEAQGKDANARLEMRMTGP